jgi:phage shock protein C
MSIAATYRPHGLYRARRGLVFGVCAGVANYFGFSVFWTRVLTLAAMVCTGFWPLGAVYILAALLMKREPRVTVDPGPTYEEQTRRAFGSLDERLRRMEARVLVKARDWDRRLDAAD